MKERLIEILKSYNYPVFLQGSLNPDTPYPDSFFTFWNFEKPQGEFYSNSDNAVIWGFWVYFYSTSPQLVESVPLQVINTLKLMSDNWTISALPTDAASDRPTHTGTMFTVLYYKK